jgi:hypothetical protein
MPNQIDWAFQSRPGSPLVLIIRPTAGGTVGSVGGFLSACAAGNGWRMSVFGDVGFACRLGGAELTDGGCVWDDVICPDHVTDGAEGFRPTGHGGAICDGIHQWVGFLLGLDADCA